MPNQVAYLEMIYKLFYLYLIRNENYQIEQCDKWKEYIWHFSSELLVQTSVIFKRLQKTILPQVLLLLHNPYIHTHTY